MSRITQKDVDEALKGLTNPTHFTAHPKADEVIRALWREVQRRRLPTNPETVESN